MKCFRATQIGYNHLLDQATLECVYVATDALSVDVCDKQDLADDGNTLYTDKLRLVDNLDLDPLHLPLCIVNFQFNTLLKIEAHMSYLSFIFSGCSGCDFLGLVISP